MLMSHAVSPQRNPARGGNCAPYSRIKLLSKMKDAAAESRELICAMVKSRYIGDGHPTFNRNPYNGYINPYYWVDGHPLLYGNNGSLDPGTYEG